MTTESLPPFATVRRGYEPTQVDSYVRQLLSQLDYTRGQAQELAKALEQAERGRPTDNAQRAPEGSAFAGLGARVEQILALAEEEAVELRARAQQDAEGTRREVAQDAERIRAEAEALAEDIRDAADRDAAARREEAQALFEAQRAEAAQAAADFETSLAERRERAEREFEQRTAAAETRAHELAAHAEQLHAEAESGKLEADKRASRLVEEARTQASELVQEAKARAERIRLESERELVAATQRRDAINAQLQNVRRMLATLSGGSAAGGLAEVADAIAPLPAAEPAVLEPSAEEPVDSQAEGAQEAVEQESGAAADEQPDLARTTVIDLTSLRKGDVPSQQHPTPAPARPQG